QLTALAVAGNNAWQGAGDVPRTAWVALVPVGDHAGDFLAFQVLLRAAKVARNDGELLVLRVRNQILFRDIRQGPDYDVLAVVGLQLGRHGLHAAAVEQVQEESAQYVVAVVAQGDLRRPQFSRYPIQDATAQARAQRTHGLSFGKHARHDGIRVLSLDVIRHAERFQVLRQHVIRKARLLLIQVHRHDVKADGRPLLQRHQYVQQRVGILAA